MERQIKITGTVVNLRMLLDDLNDNVEFQQVATVSMSQVKDDGVKLRHADVANLVIDLLTGVASAGAYDAIKLAVLAARRRGTVTTEGLDEPQGKKEQQEITPDRSDL